MPKHGRIQPKSRRCAVYGNVRGTRISNNRHAFAARAEPIHVPTFRGCKIELAVAARAGDPQEGFEAGMRPKLMRALRSALGLDAQALKIGIEQVAEDDTFRMHNTHDDRERAPPPRRMPHGSATRWEHGLPLSCDHSTAPLKMRSAGNDRPSH